jgi:hypothetical protein
MVKFLKPALRLLKVKDTSSAVPETAGFVQKGQ